MKCDNLAEKEQQLREAIENLESEKAELIAKQNELVTERDNLLTRCEEFTQTIYEYDVEKITMAGKMEEMQNKLEVLLKLTGFSRTVDTLVRSVITKLNLIITKLNRDNFYHSLHIDPHSNVYYIHSNQFVLIRFMFSVPNISFSVTNICPKLEYLPIQILYNREHRISPIHRCLSTNLAKIVYIQKTLFWLKKSSPESQIFTFFFI